MSIHTPVIGSCLLWTALLASPAAPAQHRAAPERAAAARQALIAWFECVECSNGELEALVPYGREVESALISTLNNGLSPAKRAEVERKLRRQFAAHGWPAHEEKEFVELYASNVDSRYRTRAVTALARLRTPDAAIALRQATANTNLTPDVRLAARVALNTLSSPQPP